MNTAADLLDALLVEEETALRRGDAEAVLSCAHEKGALINRLMSEPPDTERLTALVEKNRRNGQLARAGLSLLNQVLGGGVGYGADAKQLQSGHFLDESA
jgi:hypothetical protein